MATLPSWITTRARDFFPGEPFQPEPDTHMFDEDGFNKLCSGFGLSRDRLHDKCDISWKMKDGHTAWIFTDDVLAGLNKKRISVMESKGPNMKKRVREGIMSTKDGEKTFDELYADGIDTDDSDFENARMFAHCFEAIATRAAAPRLRETRLRERDCHDLDIPLEIIDAIYQTELNKEDDWEDLYGGINESKNPKAKRLGEAASIPERMVADYESRAKAEIRAGGKVEIDHGLPTVAVTMSDGSDYFFQGDEASDLLDEVPDNINEEYYILAVAQGW